jgi:predicted nucleic acid-binding protein
MIDPRITNTAIDANVLRYNQTAHDAAIDRLLRLWDGDQVNLFVQHTVLSELQHPSTPHLAKRLGETKIFTERVSLTPDELKLRQMLQAMMQGNAGQGKHWADADHVFEASKYGSYFITADERINRKAREIAALVRLRVLTIEEFLTIYDCFAAQD